MADVIGQAFYELDASTPKLNASLNKAEQQIKASGARTESAFAGSIDKGVQRVDTGFKGLIGRSKVLNSAISGIGIGAGIGAFTLLSSAVGKVIDTFVDSIKKAQEEEAQIALMTTAIRENDKAWDGNVDSIERVLHARERLGFDDNKQRESLRLLISITKDTGKALDLQRLAMDLARLKGKDLTDMSVVLGKVYGGNIGILQRYGFAVQRGSTVTQALTVLQAAAAGQAEAFANTSAGAAEALAAQWENLQEDIGTVALVVVRFVQGALLGLVNGLREAFKVIDIFRPGLIALALVITATLVPSFIAWAGAAAAAGAATIAAVAPVLPLIIGIAAAVAGASIVVNNFAMDFGDMGTRVHKIADETGRSFDEVKAAIKADMAATGDDFDTAADKIEKDMRHVVTSVESGGRAMGGSFAQTRTDIAGLAVGFDELVNATDDAGKATYKAIRDALDKTGALLTQAGPVWAARLSDGSMVYATSADELAQKLPDAQQKALDAAKDIARKTPYEIAKSFREGEDAVYQAALALGEQQTRAQDLNNQIVQKKAQLAGGELAKQLKAADPATRAAAQSQANELRREIFALQAEIDPKAALASKTLADALKSADPETRRWAEALASALQDEIDSKQPEVNRLADDMGLALPDALAKYRGDTQTNAEAQAQAVIDGITAKRQAITGTGFRAGMDFGDALGGPGPKEHARTSGAALNTAAKTGAGGSLSGTGQKVGNSFGDGLASSQSYVNDKAWLLRNGVSRILRFSGSPDWTHIRNLGSRAATEWADAMAERAGYSARRAASLRNAVSGALAGVTGEVAPTTLTAALRAAQTAGDGRNAGGDVHVHLHVEGAPAPSLGENDLMRLLRRSAYFTDRTLVGLRG